LKIRFVDVDKDGDFDALKFNDGNVEYYKNTGSLENPDFILENKNYISMIWLFSPSQRCHIPFFADMDDKDLDLFVVRDKEYNRLKKYTYEIATEKFAGFRYGYANYYNSNSCDSNTCSCNSGKIKLMAF
jgi:hypothetical protein